MRIGIANDLALAVEAIRRTLARQPDYVIAWIARDGEEAVARCAEDTPDLVLMDLFMPRLDGVEATRRIMARTPCAILVVTASMGGTMPQVFEAIGAGALDVVNTPVMAGTGTAQSMGVLLAKIESLRKLIGADSVEKRSAAAEVSRPPFPFAEIPARPPARWLVAIGSSAGGPAALAAILSALPVDFPGAIVVVQHLDPTFAAGLVAWLAQHLAMPLSLALAGERPLAGHVYIADGREHLVIDAKGRLAYESAAPDCVYVPSVDVFFESVLKCWIQPCTACLLTGMGRDGATGLLHLRTKGVHTIAQDRATSAVYGMPKAAADLQAAAEILPLDHIAPTLRRLALNYL